MDGFDQLSPPLWREADSTRVGVVKEKCTFHPHLQGGTSNFCTSGLLLGHRLGLGGLRVHEERVELKQKAVTNCRKSTPVAFLERLCRRARQLCAAG